jgi:predicted DNA-binding protein (UPF0251 family)
MYVVITMRLGNEGDLRHRCRRGKRRRPRRCHGLARVSEPERTNNVSRITCAAARDTLARRWDSSSDTPASRAPTRIQRCSSTNSPRPAANASGPTRHRQPRRAARAREGAQLRARRRHAGDLAPRSPRAVAARPHRPRRTVRRRRRRPAQPARVHRHDDASRPARLPRLRCARRVRARPHPRAHTRRSARRARPRRKGGAKPKLTGARLARARELYDARELSVDEVAAAAGVSRATLYRALNREEEPTT